MVPFCQISKYVNKGSDQAVIELQKSVPGKDEVQVLQLGRYISSHATAWIICGFSLHEWNPTIVHFSVHLDNDQMIYFRPDNLHQQLQTPPKRNITSYLICASIIHLQKLFPPVMLHSITHGIHQAKLLKDQARNGSSRLSRSESYGSLCSCFHCSPFRCRVFIFVNPHTCLHVVNGPTSFADLKM